MAKYIRENYAWSLPAAWALLIFSLSSIPHATPPGFMHFANADKLMHLGIYMPLGFFLIHALEKYPGPWLKYSLNHACCLGLLYGLSDEIHQIFVPGRYFDLADLLADGIGIFFGCVSYLFIRKYTHQLVKIKTHE